jgi:hypothetical protein
VRRSAVLVAAAVAAGALPVTADAGPGAGARASAGKAKRAGKAAKVKRGRAAVKARVAAKRGSRTAGIPSAWRASGLTRPAPAPEPAPAATPAPTPSAAPTAPVPTSTPTPAPPPSTPAPNPRSVSVGATEFAFTLSQPSVHSGEVRVQFDNSRAEDPHDLMILRGDDVVADFDEQPAGAVVARKVTLATGTYKLICPLPRHVELGMQAELRVVAAGT